MIQASGAQIKKQWIPKDTSFGAGLGRRKSQPE
jgi:hypothetical protein